uniref:Uncharacterized protein n=1 Tax=Poecilia latipinna TaxID=48699 RepID=A0A3B3W308_9TELE
MDIIWELLIILHANVIVCISGESWASLAPFWAGAINMGRYKRCLTEINARNLCFFNPETNKQTKKNKMNYIS